MLSRLHSGEGAPHAKVERQVAISVWGMPANSCSVTKVRSSLSVRRLRRSKPYPKSQSTRFRGRKVPDPTQIDSQVLAVSVSALIRTGVHGSPAAMLDFDLCVAVLKLARVGVVMKGLALPARVEFCSGRVSNMYVHPLLHGIFPRRGVLWRQARHAKRFSPAFSLPVLGEERLRATVSLLHPSLFLDVLVHNKRGSLCSSPKC
jgi:hypothetical protein